MSLYDETGARKHLTGSERKAFFSATERIDRQMRTLCMTLAFAGCRVSEALALTAYRVDLAGRSSSSRRLKKHRAGICRAVPVSPALLEALDMVHWIRELQSRRDKGRGTRLWPCSPMTGWRAVHHVMEDASLCGPHGSPKALQHAVGVAYRCLGR